MMGATIPGVETLPAEIVIRLMASRTEPRVNSCQIAVSRCEQRLNEACQGFVIRDDMVQYIPPVKHDNL